MRRFALVVNNIIWEIREEQDKLPPFHSSLEWVEISGVTPTPQERWVHNRQLGIFSPPPFPPALPPDPHTLALTEVRHAIDALVADMTTPSKMVAFLGALKKVLR